MNRDIIRQISVVIALIITIAVNVMSNALPFNGLTAPEIADMFDVYFVPAGYVFSIWSLIYLGLIAYAVFQLLPAQRKNPRLRQTGWWFVLSCAANSIWLLIWHYGYFALSVVAHPFNSLYTNAVCQAPTPWARICSSVLVVNWMALAGHSAVQVPQPWQSAGSMKAAPMMLPTPACSGWI